MSTAQLSDKFTASSLPDVYARRLRLLKKLDMVADKRVIYISAPAGYGKSVLAQHWPAHSGRETIWISLDAYDSTLPIFYKLFCTGVLSAQPENCAMTAILKSPEFEASPVEHTIRLLLEFNPDDKKYALVLDNFETLSNEEVRTSGLFVQKRLPFSFVTIVVTSNEVKDEYISITGKERSAVIGANELAFSEDEIQRYFAMRGSPLTDKESIAVHGITGGWPMGVDELAKSGKPKITRDSARSLEKFIKTNIWNSWDERLQAFMLKTCVVDEMNEEICNRLTGESGSGEILAELCVKNSFVKSEGETYRYHWMFLKFLRSLCWEVAGFPDALFITAAEYYRQTGDYINAQRYAIKSGDSREITMSSHALVQNFGAWESVEEYITFYRNSLEGTVQEDVYTQNPYLYAGFALYYFLIGDAKAASGYMDSLYENLHCIAEKHPQFLDVSLTASFLDPRKSLSALMKSLGSIDFEPPGMYITLHLPFLHRSVRDCSELESGGVLQDGGGVLGNLLKDRFNPASLLLHSGFMSEQNLLKAALEAVLEAREIKGGMDTELTFCSLMQLSAIYYALGDKNKFADTIAQTERFIDEIGAHHLLPNFAAFKTGARLRNGDASAAKAWLESEFTSEGENLELYKIFRGFITARAYIVLAQTDKALASIARLKRIGEDFRRPLDVAEAGVLQAIVEWEIGRQDKAQETLLAVLNEMSGFGFIRVVASEGAAVLPILKKISRSIEKEGGEALDACYLNQVVIAAYEQSKRRKGISLGYRHKNPVKLSKRQKLILTLLARGYKNADISRETGITIHTTKSHCAAAYEKLNAHNAMDAVLKARELGLID